MLDQPPSTPLFSFQFWIMSDNYDKVLNDAVLNKTWN